MRSSVLLAVIVIGGCKDSDPGKTPHVARGSSSGERTTLVMKRQKLNDTTPASVSNVDLKALNDLPTKLFEAGGFVCTGKFPFGDRSQISVSCRWGKEHTAFWINIEVGLHTSLEHSEYFTLEHLEGDDGINETYAVDMWSE